MIGMMNMNLTPISCVFAPITQAVNDIIQFRGSNNIWCYSNERNVILQGKTIVTCMSYGVWSRFNFGDTVYRRSCGIRWSAHVRALRWTSVDGPCPAKGRYPELGTRPLPTSEPVSKSNYETNRLGVPLGQSWHLRTCRSDVANLADFPVQDGVSKI